MIAAPVSEGSSSRPCVLVFAGADPSGGAGLYADVQAIAAMGAHALPVVTVLTVQDNNRVYAVAPVTPDQVLAQAEALLATLSIAAVKIGIVGSRRNAECIASILKKLKATRPSLLVVLDPVLASGHGDALTREDALGVIAPLLGYATLITPNLSEAMALTGGVNDPAGQASALFERGATNVLIKGGHGSGETVANHWFSADGATRTWHWPRLDGAFHGSGCTLASAIAGLLAAGSSMVDAIDDGQAYCQQTLHSAFAIGAGQHIPNRTFNSHFFNLTKEPS